VISFFFFCGIGSVTERKGSKLIGKSIQTDLRNGDSFAGWALDLRLVLSVEAVDNHRLVPLEEVVPVFVGDHPVGPAVVIAVFNAGLRLDPVEVLVQPVEQVSDELLRVLLHVVQELHD